MNIRPLDTEDRGYALFSWREGHKKSPGLDRVPWSYFKDTVVPTLGKIIDDPGNVLLGAYDNKLLGWLAMSPGKRVHTLHWIHVKHDERRKGVMMSLLNAADLGQRFIYTFRAKRLRGQDAKSLDELLVSALRDKGISATFMSHKEWSR